MSEVNEGSGSYHGFGEAIKAMKEGKRVQRAGWNGKGLFVFMQVPATISVEDIVPKMQSLPQSVKDELKRRYDKLHNGENPVSVDDPLLTIRYSNQMALVNPDNTINGWAPSASDTLAEDWVILD